MIFISTPFSIQRDKISNICMGSSLSQIENQQKLNGTTFSLILPFFRCLSLLLSIFQSRNMFSWWTKKKQAVEDVDLKNRVWLQVTLSRMNDVFTVVFFIEMVIKMLALGFKTYFTNAWCWLDFVIVAVSLLPLCIHIYPKSSAVKPFS